VTAQLLASPVPAVTGFVETGDPRLYLHPGQLAVAVSPCSMTTVLGSCVAVCLHDPVKRIGGLNHFLLPKPAEGTAPSTRYGDTAMRRLMLEMLRRGSQVSNLEATVIGGANVLHAYFGGKATLGVANVRMALDSLEVARVRVLVKDVGGNRGRHVTFHPHTGDVVVRQL
jgi:chemotaxis protein CheD